jgi:hypothetical protein
MQDVFSGTWKLNPAKSQFDANHRPSAGTMVFEANPDGRYVMRAEGIKENGEKVAERPMTFIPDGSEQPVPGLPGLKAISTLPDANTLHVEVKREDGSVVGGGTYSVSADGRSLSVTNFGYDSQLRQFKQQTAWDRE